MAISQEAIPGKQEVLTRRDWYCAIAGAAVLALTALVCVCIPPSLVHFKRIAPQDGFYKQAYLRLNAILVGMFLGSYLLVPAASIFIARLRPRWRDTYTYAALAATCGMLWLFLIHFGRHQFDGFDYNIVIDLGWRQIIGQQPYVDFPATTPPGFHLGIKYAFQLFGVSWDASLYLCGIFAATTFLWMYWAMTRLSVGGLASWTISFAVESAAFLTHCFWSYNSTALTLAAVFFLSCLLYIQTPESKAAQASYCISLLLLSLFKGNVAALMIVGGVTLVFMATRHKGRLVLLTLAGTIGSVSFLMLNHVPLGAMLTSYLGVAARRGSIVTALTYGAFSSLEKNSSILWITMLSLPLLGAVPALMTCIRRKDWRGIASTLLLFLSALLAIYGLRTNGDHRDVECTALLAAGGVVTFGLCWNGTILRRFTIAILCASIAGDLYYGATRTTVYLGGPHMFFEWQENDHRIDSGFLKNLRVGAPMLDIEREVKDAVDSNPGPYFFGPRIAFNYAALGLPSPKGYPVEWCPETFFPLSLEPRLIQNWQQDHLRTLIFVKDQFAGSAPGGAYTFYPQQFLDVIQRAYVRDDSYPDITIYRLRVPSA